MDIIIVGYGRMGKALQETAQQRNINTTIISHPDELLALTPKPNTMALEFTNASNCLENYNILLEKNIPIVSGTTGWEKEKSDLKEHVKQHGGRFFWSANFAIGLHLFAELTKHAVILNNYNQTYEIYGQDLHHQHKKDAPSGTAQVLADVILQNSTVKETLVTNPTHTVKPHELVFNALRAGHDLGTHTITLDGPDDTITLSHHVKNRQVFANGALDCGTWLAQQPPGYYEISNYLNSLTTAV